MQRQYAKTRWGWKPMQIACASAVFSGRADAVWLFDEEEREMFRKLIAVSKIGPKTAISILGSLTPQDITTAILTEM